MCNMIELRWRVGLTHISIVRVLGLIGSRVGGVFGAELAEAERAALDGGFFVDRGGRILRFAPVTSKNKDLVKAERPSDQRWNSSRWTTNSG